MADQIIRAKDSGGTPRDLARQLDDGSWGLAVDGYMTIETNQYNTLIGHIDSLETLLTNIGNNTDGLEGFSDGVEGLLTSLNTYVDTLETIANDIDLNTDELEARIGEVSATPTANTLQDRLKGVKTVLDAINGAVATSANQVTTNTKLDTLIGHVDQVEAKLDTLAGHVDGVEALLTTISNKDFATQTTLASALTALNSIDTKTSTVIGHVDAVEGKLDILHADLDGVETLLQEVENAVDSLESQIGEISTTPTANTVQDRLKGVKTTLDGRFSASATKITTAVRKSDSGDNTVVTPASGKRIRLHWIGMSTPESNVDEMLVIVKLGSATKYRWNMTAPGAFSHWETVEGGVDESFVVNLSSALPVDINYTYEEF